MPHPPKLPSSSSAIREGRTESEARLTPVRLISTFLTCVIALAACGGSEPAATVLFIGNSYTHSNNMPDTFAGIAASAGTPVEVEMIAPGGWWLSDHANSPETTEAIRTGEWDYVVLQEQSEAPAINALASRETFPAARSLANLAIGGGARIYVFQTWGHANGSSNTGHNRYDSMQIDLARNLDEIADSIIAGTSPVGAAWWLVLVEHPEIGLFQPDGSHPSPEGSYLAAAVMAATLLGVDLETVDEDGGLDEGVAAVLRGVAARVAGGERPWD